jgi:hypothetical protein
MREVKSSRRYTDLLVPVLLNTKPGRLSSICWDTPYSWIGGREPWHGVRNYKRHYR